MASVGTSLAMRVIHRGTWVPGWDYLLTVEGQYLLVTRGLVGALAEMLVKVRTFWLPPAAYSIPYGLVPGVLSSWWPSLFWQPATVFVAWLATLTCLLVATGWRVRSPRGWTVALLCWGSSPALLSYSVEGYPWGSGMLPHALALAMALSARPWRWWATLLALIAVWELPWHGYEIGKTVGITLLLCAVLAPGVGIARRLAWALTAISSIVAVWLIWPSHNMIALDHGNVGTGVGLLHAFNAVPGGLTRLAHALVGWKSLILPALAAAGILALPWTGIRRNALAACWLVQVVLIVLLSAAGTDADSLLRPRRFQAVDVMSIALVLAAMRGGPTVLRASLLTLLLTANAWTVVDGIRFARTPYVFNPFSLPGVESADGVGTIDPPSIQWAERLLARAHADERLLVLHGQTCPMEGFTNPVAVLERLYILLGHDVFRERVVAVAMPDAWARYVTLPVVDVHTAIDTLRPGMIVEVDSTCAETMADVRRFLEARFALVALPAESPRILRYRLAARLPP
jgi:TusA-related sulfurtransferase